MANPNPSPETRFKPGQSGNITGKSTEVQLAEQKAATISANLRLEALSCLQEKLDNGEMAADELIQKDTLKLFKDSEDRAHGTPVQATRDMSDGPSMAEVLQEMSAKLPG